MQSEDRKDNTIPFRPEGVKAFAPGAGDTLDTDGASDDRVMREIEYIRKVMDDSRKILFDNGVNYVIWGLAVILGIAGSYSAMWLGLDPSSSIPAAWGGVYLAAFLANFAIARKKRRMHGHVKNLAEIIHRHVWGGMGISAGLLMAAGLASGVALSAAMGLLCTLMACACFISSGLVRSRLLRAFSFCTWAAAAGIFFLPAPWAPVAVAGVVFSFFITPGVILLARHKHR